MDREVWGFSERGAHGSDFCAKIGSSAGAESRQDETFFGIVARLGGFFFALTQCEPDVFLGGVRFCRRETAAFFVFLVK